ncbi:MAG: hypothetical protein LBJ38_01600 [Oscillospiraceae bacterium]|nr:hypothetical protein [Oscillospiraceae bacterium]
MIKNKTRNLVAILTIIFVAIVAMENTACAGPEWYLFCVDVRRVGQPAPDLMINGRASARSFAAKNPLVAKTASLDESAEIIVPAGRIARFVPCWLSADTPTLQTDGSWDQGTPNEYLFPTHCNANVEALQSSFLEDATKVEPVPAPGVVVSTAKGRAFLFGGSDKCPTAVDKATTVIQIDCRHAEESEVGGFFLIGPDERPTYIEVHVSEHA